MALRRKSFAKRIAVAIVGGTITLVGIAMIVLPGPAIVVIPLGLSILATEFAWARRYLRKCRTTASQWKDKMKTHARARSARAATASGGACPASSSGRGRAPK
jgi:uncharacterized protein (TIGR02611 family)